MTNIEIGPLQGQTHLSSGLDYYKLTMSQLEYQRFQEVDVTFTFKNRSDRPLYPYVGVDELQARLDDLRRNGWTDEELDGFRAMKNSEGNKVFSDDYIDYISSNELPRAEVSINPDTQDIAVESVGEACLVTFWETIVMSQVNEMYFEGMIRDKGLDIDELYAEGDRRLDEKIAYFNANPDVKFADFGTRRRFSLRWQEHVLARLMSECPDNFIGTSNIYLSAKHEMRPIGTFAHELPMIYAGVADAEGGDVRGSHTEMLSDWYELYGEDLAIALSDTFGVDFFFETFTPELAAKYIGTRQDSGDPVEYGYKAIEFYRQNGLDPVQERTIFSDGLDIKKVDRIKKCFNGILGNSYGIGTDLTNDVGLKAGNNVMKATHVRLANGNGAFLVKLSEDKGKHTGRPEDIQRYKEEIFCTNANKKEVVSV